MRARKILQCSSMTLKRDHASDGNLMTKEVKHVLGGVDDQTMVVEVVENLMYMVQVRGPVDTGDQNVVKVDKGKVDVVKNSIYHPLECLHGIP